jgi:hypothetical protein
LSPVSFPSLCQAYVIGRGTNWLIGPVFPKETLNARSEYTTSQDDGAAEHRINQYLIRQEIGRGSFGAVHFAVDQYGQEYVSIFFELASGVGEETKLC